MNSKSQKVKGFLALVCVMVMIAASVMPSAMSGSGSDDVEGFDGGITWKPSTSLKQMTFVQSDNESIIDDLAYLAAIPTTVFYDAELDRMFASPLLFYEDPLYDETFYTQSLNAREGIDYFMEDWLAYTGGDFDELELINMQQEDIKEEDWDADVVTEIEADDIYTMASEIALNDWAYSKEAVIAVVDDTIEKPDNSTSNQLIGSIEFKDVIHERFEVPQTNEMYPEYNEFTVPDGYRFLKVRSWYPTTYLTLGIPGFEGIINMSIPAGDRDIQIYNYNTEMNAWMMAGITSEWNAQGGMDIDKTSCYVYEPGRWSVALTDVPTKSDTQFESENPPLTDEDLEVMGLEVQKHRSILGLIQFGRYGTISEVLKNMIRGVMYKVDVEMFPGTVIEIPDSPPYGCRQAEFTLEWDDPSVELGFSIIGPSGEEVLSTREVGVSSTCPQTNSEDIATPSGTENDMVVNRLGECLPGESYKICVFYQNDAQKDVDFTISYSWEQNMTRETGDKLASACEGAILASIMNAPLLYTKDESVPQCTIDTLYQLGVEKITFVDLGSYASSEVHDSLETVGKVVCWEEYEETYDYIRDSTGSVDLVFSTTDPWTAWYVSTLQPEYECENQFSIGPASYIAAVHGAPLLLIDNHPEFSSALPWHNELWRRHSDGFSKLPTVSEMSLTGTRVYEYIQELGYDVEGEEPIITVGGQYDIGLSWDRVFVGKGEPGRFYGSPADLAVWIAKNVFYPQLVLMNPAITDVGSQNLFNGSTSERKFPYYGSLSLRVHESDPDEVFEYPVLDTLICYDHRFNSRASDYWGFVYKCTDGSIPGQSASYDAIDDGVMVAVNGEEGAFLADLSGSETQPFYLRQGGFDPVFSTQFEANMHNLNEGVLLWMVNTHGSPLDGGGFMFWDVDQTNPNGGYPTIPLAGYNKEVNPWRGYEWLRGSTEEPDTMTMEIHGILPALLGNPNPSGLLNLIPLGTALDWAPAKKPLLDALGTIGSLPVLRFFTPDWLENTQDYYDGVIITVLLGRFGTSWYNGTQVDDALGNLHSAGISSVACLPAGKYLHLTMMRHGSPFQIMDPWATSWYSDVWQNNVPRGIALGEPIGEIYAEGIKKVGISYIGDPPVWWWDLAENVCLYGDPHLIAWAPSTEYSEDCNWDLSDVAAVNYQASTGFAVDGHMPIEVVEYPNAREPVTLMQSVLWIVGIVAVASLILIGGVVLLRKRK